MNQRGISIVEIVLVAAAVLFLGLLIANLPSAISSINKSRHTSIARDIAGRKIENVRKQPYADLSYGANSFTDSNLSQLPSSSASYNIEECPITICTQSEKIKQVKVSVNWNESGDAKKVELTTFVAEGGIGQ